MEYTVRPGDTLFQIAKRFGVTVDAILAANPQITNANMIMPGQVITIPTEEAPPSGTTQYTVKPGDTLFKIAQQFGITLNELLRLNPQISDPSRISPGQVINVPVQAGPPPTGRVYIVQPGDTMYGIARRFGVSLQELIAANPQISDPSRLTPGQRISIPGGEGVPGEIVRTNITYGHANVMADLMALRRRYPFISSMVIGNSVLGRELVAIRLGTGPKEIHYNGAHHANEWITTPLLMKFIEEFARNYEEGSSWNGFDVRAIFRSTSIWIVPMVNPDGVELVQRGLRPGQPFYNELLRWNGGSTNFRGWKANIRGVDLNRQYRANWELARRAGPPGPAPALYAGPAPESEPETKAIANFTRAHNFRLVIAYHTQGEIIFWNYLNLAPTESRSIVNEFSRLSGYRAVSEAPEVAAHGGYKDWFILAYRRPGFTIEVGRGVNPLPISQFPRIWNSNVRVMLYAATV